MLHSDAPNSPLIEINIRYISTIINTAELLPKNKVFLSQADTSLKKRGSKGIIDNGIATLVKLNMAFLVKLGAYFCIKTSQRAYDTHAVNANAVVIPSFFVLNVLLEYPIMNTAIQQIIPDIVIA